MKREEAEKIYDLGKDAVVDFILQLVDRIEKIEATKATIKAIKLMWIKRLLM